jgi:uncharacterized protein YecE (DUF72 family)
MSSWRLGTIGFSYKDWVGGFYPVGTTQREYLSYYSKVFNSVELDTTFHALPRKEIVQSWFAATPSEFRFCLKTPRTITHELGLRGAQGFMTEFLDALHPLQEKAGPILIQLPPSYTQERYFILQEFLESLPQTHRYAIEFRHSSWYNDKTTQLLSQYHVCWVSIDYPNLPRQINLTTDFHYLRWIGVNGMYHLHSYEREDKTSQLRLWLRAILPYKDQMPEIFGFFNNDYAGFAAGSCKRFMLLAGLLDDEQDTPFQERLF